MSEAPVEWLKCHGMGRERMVRLLSEYLQELGFVSEDALVPGERMPMSELRAKLSRPNPSVPAALESLAFRVKATGSGCMVYWESPRVLENADGTEKLRRFTTEMVAHMVRVVSTSSRGAARVAEARQTALPFQIS